MGSIGDNRAVEPLIEALSDSDEKVRQEVEAALGKLTGQDFGSHPGLWRAWFLRPRKGTGR